ncbi:hypothetical protein ES754_10355 [Psychrobacter frigidicola]|uniref:Uncharacterized protein n=1 Tax=Psychrobacter frigidicola TaxID=45611 RepID=A0A5C7A437_9GAMM|nr:hypothetical protein [Psychrobacter frigidicola]TXD96530.1 hypothetical protein ES754_10355 [Psychrobacter frigidicola]
MVVTFSNAALNCKDVKYGNDNYHENMEALAIEARLRDGYFSRYHEGVVSELCGYGDDDIEGLIDRGYIRRSEVEGIKEALGLDSRSRAGRNYEYAWNKFNFETELSSAQSGNLASFYADEPNSECGKMAKRALAGDRIAIRKLEKEDSICTSGYED